MDEQALNEVRAKMAHLEAEISSIKGLLKTGDKAEQANARPQNSSGSPQPFDPAAAEATFRQALMTLRTMALLRSERFIFLAAADPHNVTTSGPQPVQALLTEEIKPALAKLGAALSNPPRLKILFVLLAQEECTTGLLAEASGVTGGNLFQQLNELYSANLIFQPSRGRYRISETGRLIVEVLAWSSSNRGKGLSQPGWFENEPES